MKKIMMIVIMLLSMTVMFYMAIPMIMAIVLLVI